MYASLIGAGISQLYDLYQSATSSSKGTGSTSFPPPGPPPADDASATGGTSAGGGLSDALQKLMVDIQANSTASATGSADATGTTGTDATATVASDLHAVFKGLKGAGHHHGHGDPAGTGNGTDPLNGLASSLLAYAKNQSLGTAATTSTSLTA